VKVFTCRHRRRNSSRLLVVVPLSAVLIAGCTVPSTREARQETAPAQKVPISASDGSWELVTSSFVGSGRIPGVPRATLSFQDGRLSAFSGCNQANAAAYHVEGRLEVVALAATRRGCPEPLTTFEARFFKLLRSQPVYRVDGDTLTLLDGEHSVRFRRITAKPAAGASSDR
jgi:heat shock protein HslJ